LACMQRTHVSNNHWKVCMQNPKQNILGLS
jgi:hypothetical protein